MASPSRRLGGDVLIESGSNETADAGIDVIIRYHRADRELELDMALMSVYQQTYAPVRVILVTQNFSAEEYEQVTHAVHAYDWGRRHVAPVVISVDAPPGVDARSKLLNVGLKALQLRYVAFLDFDDYLYSHAYEHLIQIAQDDQVALAFGGIVAKHIRVFDNCIFNVRRVAEPFAGRDINDFLSSNFCPIHSFVVDRKLVTSDELYFNDSLIRLEDYDFLLRLAMRHKFSFSGLDRKVGVYNWRLDGSNSVQVFNVDDEKQVLNRKHWNEARRHIWRLQTKAKDLLA